MRLRPARARMLLAVLFASSIVGQPASAGDYHEWTSMQAGANQPGLDSLESQCLASMYASGWTKADCTTLRHIAQQGKCRRTTVPNETWYDSMTGPGQSVNGSTVKRLRGQTPALECTVAPTKVAHWYTNFPNACNNLGTNPRRSTSLQTSKETIVQQFPRVLHFEGLRVCGPCGVKIPDVSIWIPGGVEHHFEYDVFE